MNKLFVGSGVYGTCYLDDDNVIKVYSDLKSFPYQQKAFIGIENDTYVFPKNIEFSDDEISIIMDAIFYDKSKTIAKPLIFQKNVNYNSIVSSIDKAYFDSDKLSDETKILTDDVHAKNILFTGSVIKVIDTDKYDFSVKQLEEVKKENIIKLNKGLLDGIIGVFDKYGLVNKDYRIINYIMKDDGLTNLYFRLTNRNMEIDNRFLKEFLIEFKKNLEKNYNCSIDSTCDVKRILLK